MAGNGQGTQRPQSSGLQYNAIRPTQGYGAQQPQGQPRLNSAMNPASANSATGRTQTVNQFTPMPASQGQAVSAAGPPRAAQATGQSYQPQVNTPTAQNVGVQFSTLPPAIPDTTPRPNPTPIPTSNINPPGPTNAGTPKWQQTPVWGNNDSTLGDYRRLADVILGKNPNWRTAQSNIGTRPFEQRSTDLGKYGVGNASDYNVYFGEDEENKIPFIYYYKKDLDKLETQDKNLIGSYMSDIEFEIRSSGEDWDDIVKYNL